jgi:hypothetical protein
MAYLGTFTEVGTVDTASIADDAVTADKLANTINTDIATGVTAGTTASAALPKAGGAMTGAITTNSTFDGRDVATDGTKLDGIASGATAYTHPTTAGNKHIPSGGSSDQVLTYDSSGTAVWAEAGGGGGYKSMQFLTADSGAWTKPSGINTIIAEVIGAGGAGTSKNYGSCGAAGGYALKQIDVTNINTVNYTTGNGGYGTASNSNYNTGAQGNASSFGNYMTCNGGTVASTSGNAWNNSRSMGNTALGGTATGGDINHTGELGILSGGSTKYGIGAGFGNANTWGTNPHSPSGYGSGGAGSSTSGYVLGSTGAGGCVVIWEYE